MKQLKLNFSDNSLLDHYQEYKVIDEGNNKFCSWLDSLSEDDQKISYNEFIYNTKECMDYENWIHINKTGLGKSAFNWIYMYLKNLKKKSDRLEKLKNILNDVGVSFEEGNWQSIDKDCERRKLN